MSEEMISNAEYEKNLVFFATAPVVTAGSINQIENGIIKKYWIGRLRRKFVGNTNGKFKFNTPEEAKCEARSYRQGCIDEATKLKLYPFNKS